MIIDPYVRVNSRKFLADGEAYRAAFDRLFSPALSGPRAIRSYFFDVLITSTQLYLDHLLIADEMRGTAIQREREPASALPDEVQITLRREKFGKHLRSLHGWDSFRRNAFSELHGLYTLQDYLETFALHLPEIYEKTILLEEYAAHQEDRAEKFAATQLATTLQNIGRGHILFVLQPLQWVTDEESWRDAL